MEKSFSTIKNITNTYQTCFDKNFDIKYPNFFNYGGLRNLGHFKKSFNDKPLISIITTSLNSSKTIEKTILSVLNQTYDNVEFIIVDGNSTDDLFSDSKVYFSLLVCSCLPVIIFKFPIRIFIAI